MNTDSAHGFRRYIIIQRDECAAYYFLLLSYFFPLEDAAGQSYRRDNAYHAAAEAAVG